MHIEWENAKECSKEYIRCHHLESFTIAFLFFYVQIYTNYYCRLVFKNNVQGLISNFNFVAARRSVFNQISKTHLVQISLLQSTIDNILNLISYSSYFLIQISIFCYCNLCLMEELAQSEVVFKASVFNIKHPLFRWPRLKLHSFIEAIFSVLASLFLYVFAFIDQRVAYLTVSVSDNINFRFF